MSNEIKRGDKVRVSKDAPKMYLRGFDHIFTGVESVVSEVEDDNAVIIFNTDHINSQTTIPTKYLVKVDAEAKEAKFKAGDKVRVKGSVLLEGGVFSIIGADYHEKLGWRYELNIHEWYPEIDLELYTEPTEQTEGEEDARIRQMEAELDEFRKAELDRVLHPEKYHTSEVEVNPNFINWTLYEAELAHDLAVQMVKCNRNNYDKIGNMAVRVAKSIVENLKQK